MTVHVSVRSISALLVLSVSLLGLPAGAPAQSVVAPQKTAPTLAERLDRLAAEIDRNRIDLHVPGAALAIVRGDEVIFARGFGVADVEKKTPVTPDTPFSIGSVTKAFTATLVGMLVDEGRMRWDDPVEKYLPEPAVPVQQRAISRGGIGRGRCRRRVLGRAHESAHSGSARNDRDADIAS